MKPMSIFAQIFALTFALMIVTFAAVAAVLLLIPPPERGRMSVDEMSWALDAKPSSVIGVVVKSSSLRTYRSRSNFVFESNCFSIKYVSFKGSAELHSPAFVVSPSFRGIS